MVNGLRFAQDELRLTMFLLKVEQRAAQSELGGSLARDCLDGAFRFLRNGARAGIHDRDRTDRKAFASADRRAGVKTNSMGAAHERNGFKTTIARAIFEHQSFVI